MIFSIMIHAVAVHSHLSRLFLYELIREFLYQSLPPSDNRCEDIKAFDHLLQRKQIGSACCVTVCVPVGKWADAKALALTPARRAVRF